MQNTESAVLQTNSLKNFGPGIDYLARGIARLQPRPHHTTLLTYLNTCWPEASFKHRLTRSGWFRTGGIRHQDGTLLSQDMQQWLERSLRQSGDFEQLLIDLESLQPLVTRYNGATHFFTASYGHAPEACWQLEVEELQEVMDRQLLNSTAEPPQDLADLTDPLHPAKLDGQPLGFPVYRLGCLINLHLALETAVNAPSLRRFFSEWNEGPGSGLTDFHRHWFFQRHQSRNRYGVDELRLQPHAIKANMLKTHPWNLHDDVTGIAAQLRSFDKAAGFFGAWYFGMVAGNLVPRELAERLQDDWLKDYRYISERQAEWIRNWLHKPYTL
ncbi:hypothetical protein [Nitrincola iocasae]|uniref:Uncharacterized protein n=1 Tax=Nitrincola iocasae TaxID=2614693 RepID=A0A5J6L8T3_9GAMM|nr:hypothetical protein [Nitrincola iocasae]QEW05049.1 hypothetical protein F5I99_00220 [Nitrincola iocasae]